MLGAAERLEDAFPHGTVEGWDRGCRTRTCDAGLEFGLSCSTARRLLAGDYRYPRMVAAGMDPGAIADALGLVPDARAVAPGRKSKKVLMEAGADLGVGDEREEPMEEERKAPKMPTPAEVAAKMKKPVTDPVPERPRAVSPEEAAAIRAWAPSAGFQVGSRGMIPRAVVEAYRAGDKQAAIEHVAAVFEVPLEVVVGFGAESEARLHDRAFAAMQFAQVLAERDQALAALELVRAERDQALAALELVLAKWGELAREALARLGGVR